MAKTGKKQNFRVDVMPGGDIIVHFLLLSLQRCKDLVCQTYPIITTLCILSTIKWFSSPQLQKLLKSTHP